MIKDLFLLNPEITFLNHGSFGACPRPVFEVYQEWQRKLEWQPVKFLGRDYDGLMAESRERLAEYLGVQTDSLMFVPNASTGLNQVARSLASTLREGDEILTCDHEYGAMDKMWDFMVQQTGIRIVRQPIPLPIESREQVIEAIWSGVTPRTKVIFLSHITSTTAIILPIQEICQRAREAGIITIIDGAHAPGQLALNIPELDPDFYAGNCHKWLCAPKGSAFLYVRESHQTMVDPLIVSWGWNEGLGFAEANQWQGTREIASFLSVPSAIDFQAEHEWEFVRKKCHKLAKEALIRCTEITQLDPITPISDEWFMQMVAIPVLTNDPEALKAHLYDEYQIELPITSYRDQHFMRVSIQGYNTAEDVDYLVASISKQKKRF